MAQQKTTAGPLRWRRPVWAWTILGALLAGPVNPLALAAGVAPFLDRASPDTGAAAFNYVVIAVPATAAALLAAAAWLAPKASLSRTITMLGVGVAVGALALGVTAAFTMNGQSLDARINLGIAVLTMVLVGGAAIAAAAGVLFRYVAMTRQRRQKSGRFSASREATPTRTIA